MHRPVGTRFSRFALLLLIGLAVLPLRAGAHGSPSAQQNGDLHMYYMPVVLGAEPDLVVESITVNSNSAVVVIKNQGGLIQHTTPFWVDLYVDPHPMPSEPNQTWDRSCTQGIVWGIPPQALPLEAGEVLTLTYCAGQEESDPYLVPELSKFVIALTPGTPIAVQVDSANMKTTYGGVLEKHEVLGTAYNNIGLSLSIPGAGCDAAGSPPPTSNDRPRAQSGDLPPRLRYSK